MITWLQTAFGKHHKWILTGILAVVGVSFVFTIGAVPRGQASRQSAPPRMFFGVDLNDEQAMGALATSEAMSLAWQGRQARNSDEMQQALFGRITLMHLADEWQIPRPTEAQVKDYIQTLAIFKNDAGEFDANKYQTFVDNLTVNPRTQMYRQLMPETMAQNWRLQQVIAVMSGPGYALPYSAEIQAALNQTTWDLNVATLDFDKFQPQLEVTEAALQNLFNHNPEQFKIPAQVQLSYVHFTAPPSTATPTADDLKKTVLGNPKDFPDVKNPDQLDAKTTAAATGIWRQAQSAHAAGLQAANLTDALTTQKVAQGSPEFNALLKQYNVTLEPLPPVVADKPAPATSPIPDEILQKATQELSAQTYFSDPLQLADSAAVLFYDGATPAHSPTPEEAHVALVKAYTEQEKTKQFEAKGKEVAKELAAAVAGGKSFSDAATALGLTVKNYPKVSFGDPPADMSYDLLAALANPSADGLPLILTLKPGTVSPMLPTQGEGVLVDVVKRDTPTLTADSPVTVNILKDMEAQEGESNANAILTPIVNGALRKLQQAGG